MADLNIDLSQHTDKYAPDSVKLLISKKINFVFGKNGTGKTTIADEVSNQMADSYDVHVFKDFDGVAVNERLDAVALGTENAEIQKQIDIVDGEIIDILGELEKPKSNAANTFTKAAATKKSFDDQQKKLENFYIKSAQQIKNQSNPNISSTSYDKNDFKAEITDARLLSSDEIAANKDTIKADKKPDVRPITLPHIDLEGYLNSTNQVLESFVKQPASIPELNNNSDKQQFAKTGLDIHEHKQGEVCAFCGNEISEDRWSALGNYFNSEVKTLEDRIGKGIASIEEELKMVNAVNDVDEHIYYRKYSKSIEQLNTKIQLRKAEYKAFLENLNTELNNKTKNLFSKSKLLTLKTPEDFDKTQDELSALVESHNTFTKNLTIEQSKAKNVLRLHEIHKKMEVFKYAEEDTKLKTLSSLNSVAQNALQDKKDELDKKQQERTDLISKTKDEEKIAIKISGLLKSMGVSSFELKLVTDTEDDQKGQYQIKGHDDKMRPITALSKGEKNIIAFLYFIFNLERADGSTRPKVIVLDDPMTSNDDTMQYTMIGEIQKFYRKLKDGNYFLLFTHNVHFYLNVRPNTAGKYEVDGEEVSFYKKFGVYHLFSDGKHSTIRTIEKGKNDFSTSYETLWKELVFLFNASGATADLMLSPCRKICETYMNFTKKGIEAFYGDNINAKKLFDVNQHSIDDMEAEQNGKTKDEIKEILSALFTQNGAEEHFKSYWKENL